MELRRIFGKAKGVVPYESIKNIVSKGTTELKLTASQLMQNEIMDRLHAFEDDWNGIISTSRHFLVSWKTKAAVSFYKKAEFVRKWTEDWNNKNSK